MHPTPGGLQGLKRDRWARACREQVRAEAAPVDAVQVVRPVRLRDARGERLGGARVPQQQRVVVADRRELGRAVGPPGHVLDRVGVPLRAAACVARPPQPQTDRQPLTQCCPVYPNLVNEEL